MDVTSSSEDDIKESGAGAGAAYPRQVEDGHDLAEEDEAEVEDKAEFEADAEDAEIRALDDLWRASKDHRTVVFKNKTELWVELTGWLEVGGGHGGHSDGDSGHGGHSGHSHPFITTESRVLIRPHGRHSWNFLGESQCTSPTFSTFNMFGLLPDFYQTSYFHGFYWTARLLFGDQTDQLVKPANQMNQLKVGGKKNWFSLTDLPAMGALQVKEVDITKQAISSLQLLSQSRILHTCWRQSQLGIEAEDGGGLGGLGGRDRDRGRAQRRRKAARKDVEMLVDGLPLPFSVRRELLCLQAGFWQRSASVGSSGSGGSGRSGRSGGDNDDAGVNC